MRRQRHQRVDARKWAESPDDSPELTAEPFEELLCPEDFLEPTAGIASEFFHYFGDINNADPTRPVVLMYRSSSNKQVQEGQHDDGLDQAILELRRYGVNLGKRLIAVFDGVESASIYKERPLLEQTSDFAGEHNAILVVGMTRERALRHDGYDGKTNRTEQPTTVEYIEFTRKAGVPIATLLCPDTPVKGVSTKRGMRAQRAKQAGRPKQAVPEFNQRELLDAVLKLARTIPY